MTQQLSPGQLFYDALEAEKPLQIVGVINAYCALLAERAGFKALYLSGSGVAAAAYGLPDLAMTTLPEVAEEARRVTAVTALPLLVDVDTAWGNAHMIARTVKTLCRTGVAAIHIEDQVQAKRCGHRPGKQLVAVDEMVDRIKSAVDARPDSKFVIMARTDAFASEGLSAAIDRAQAYIAAGADMIFPEALRTLEDYTRFTKEIQQPILANITEYGQTPLLTTKDLAKANVAMALYPLSAFRAMSHAAVNAYQTIRKEGTQKNVLDGMQTRDEFYDVIGYQDYEKRLDQLFSENKS